MKRPAWRMTLGSRSGPKSRSARTETTRISGTENIGSYVSGGVAGLPPHSAGGLTSESVQASGPAREDYLHTRQPHRNAGFASDAAEDPQPVRCAPRLL